MLFCFLILKLVDWFRKLLFEKFFTSKHTWVKKIHLREYIKCIVLHWRTTQCDTIFAGQKLRRFRYLTCWIFYGLRFIQDDIIKIVFYKKLYIAS